MFAEPTAETIRDEDLVVIHRPEQQITSPQFNFERLWDTANAKRGYGWEKNPFVWCVAFRRVEL